MAEYIDREIAIERIQPRFKPQTIYGEGYLNGIERATNILELMPAADVQPVDRWISVKDRLPDENQKCLVYRDIDADLKITTGIWHSEWKAFDGLRHGTRLEDTIAWMPLPEPPKDDDEQEVSDDASNDSV